MTFSLAGEIKKLKKGETLNVKVDWMTCRVDAYGNVSFASMIWGLNDSILNVWLDIQDMQLAGYDKDKLNDWVSSMIPNSSGVKIKPLSDLDQNFTGVIWEEVNPGNNDNTQATERHVAMSGGGDNLSNLQSDCKILPWDPAPEETSTSVPKQIATTVILVTSKQTTSLPSATSPYSVPDKKGRGKGKEKNDKKQNVAKVKEIIIPPRIRMKKVTEKEKFVCLICGWEERFWSRIKRHVGIHVDKKTGYFCNICKRNFKSGVNHLKSYHAIKIKEKIIKA